MEIGNKQVKTYAHVLVELGPFRINQTFEVEDRDASKLFEEAEEIIAVEYYDINSCTIDGVKYFSEPLNQSEAIYRDGRTESVAKPSSDSFFTPGSNTLN